MGAGAADAGVSASTATGPRSVMRVAEPGSVVPRHEQLDGDFAGWCIGQAALPVWMHVQVTPSSACALVTSDTGAAVNSAS